MQVKT